MQEAWDGPALLVFSDGLSVGATLDRNGLRPARYMVTQGVDGKETVHVMSEVGVTKALDQFSADPEGNGQVLIESGRLGPGEMLSVNLKEGKVTLNDELKSQVAGQRPYQEWVKKAITPLARHSFSSDVAGYASRFVTDPTAKASALLMTANDVKPVATEEERNDQSLIEMQTFFGWGIEDTEIQISAMAQDAIEATISMGDDAPLAALSVMPHVLYDYFKQRFAQVTNPPIDSLREGAVMSLSMYLGPRGDPLSPTGQVDVRVKIESPVMNMNELKALEEKEGVKLSTLSILYPSIDALTIGGLESQLEKLCDDAVAAIEAGATVLNLSDLLESHSSSAADAYKGQTIIAPLLAVAAVHHRLIAAGISVIITVALTIPRFIS
jgi:glutamate synthase (ferredoxin)